MARIRTIKPEFWTSEQVMELSPMARLLFIGMWNFCDDRGVHPVAYKTLKAEVFPADDVTASQVEQWVGEMVTQDLLKVFTDNVGRSWWHVTGWHHQLINRPSKTRYPEPPRNAPLPSEAGEEDQTDDIGEDSCDVDHGALTDDSLSTHGALTDDSLSTHGALTDDSLTEGKGREGKEQPPLPPDKNSGGVSPPGFADFWKTYPRKVGKGAAEKAWKRAKVNGHQSVVMAALEAQKRGDDWQRDNGRFIPNPATWINQRRWEDGEPAATEVKRDWI